MMGTSKQPTHAVLHISNWDGERDVMTSLCTQAGNGDFLYFDSGKPVLEYHGDEVLKVWPLVPEPAENLQDRVQPWMMACFGAEIAADKSERNHRFLEEALELVQACGCTAEDAHALVDYTFDRPLGDPPQEVGGVMITLAALCLANNLDMHEAAEYELRRIWTKVDAIREKQKSKPALGPLLSVYKERLTLPAIRQGDVVKAVSCTLECDLPAGEFVAMQDSYLAAFWGRSVVRLSNGYLYPVEACSVISRRAT